MNFEEIDGELCIIDENDKISHVFEKGDFSRVTYRHMIGWIQANFDSKLSIEENWARAEEAWDTLTPEHQMLLWSLGNQESQCAQDICTGLLATLSEYKGLTMVKKTFHNAIKNVLEQFTSSSSLRTAGAARTPARG